MRFWQALILAMVATLGIVWFGLNPNETAAVIFTIIFIVVLVLFKIREAMDLVGLGAWIAGRYGTSRPPPPADLSATDER